MSRQDLTQIQIRGGLLGTVFGILLLGGGLLGAVELGLDPGVQGFAAVAEVPRGLEVPLAVVDVVEPVPVLLDGLLVEEVVPVDDVVPLLLAVDELSQGPATVEVVWPWVPPVTLPALPATPGVPGVAAGDPVDGWEVDVVP
ncbi:MAG TPA: hypothetical protein VFT65_17195 [Candidatus Angelobacter sp.]|nr:hypothetical protein [Candidatus Angelobacter sp.]